MQLPYYTWKLLVNKSSRLVSSEKHCSSVQAPSDDGVWKSLKFRHLTMKEHGWKNSAHWVHECSTARGKIHLRFKVPISGLNLFLISIRFGLTHNQPMSPDQNGLDSTPMMRRQE